MFIDTDFCCINNSDRTPNPNTMKQELISLFSGIIAGDGDIGTRMASSHEGAKPPYLPLIDSYVENFYKDLKQSQICKPLTCISPNCILL